MSTLTAVYELRRQHAADRKTDASFLPSNLCANTLFFDKQSNTCKTHRHTYIDTNTQTQIPLEGAK